MANPENESSESALEKRIVTSEKRRQIYLHEITAIKNLLLSGEYANSPGRLRPSVGPEGVPRVRGYIAPGRVSDMADARENTYVGIAYPEGHVLMEEYSPYEDRAAFIDLNTETNEITGMRQTGTKEGGKTEEILDWSDERLLGKLRTCSIELCNTGMTTPYEAENSEATRHSGRPPYEFQLAQLQNMQDSLF